MNRSIDPIDFERDPAAAGCRVQLRSLTGAEHHHVTVEDEVNRKHDRTAIIDDSHPAHLLLGQQPETFAPGQLLPADPVPRPPVYSRCRDLRRRFEFGRQRENVHGSFTIAADSIAHTTSRTLAQA
ncbi:MAG TPA: hypothetical protein VEF71_26665 [Streptosporangiaceae bacterium]|nr:hypothetical protein [Streptosporangiaceae bacterium]